MHALANCKAALQGASNAQAEHNYREIHTLVQQADARLQPQQQQHDSPLVPRVDATTTEVQARMCILRVSSTPTTASLAPHPLRVRQAAAKRTIARQQCLDIKTPTINLPSQPPALSTRSKVLAALPAPPATRTRHQSKLLRPSATQTSISMHHQANAALSNSMCVRLQHAITHLEQQVHQALSVMDRDSGKLLTYKQLMNHPKYKKQWSTSSANEFGRLAQGV